MLLRPGQLHPHRPAHRTGQQKRIRAHIIGTVPTITARRLIAPDLNRLSVQPDKLGQIAEEIGLGDVVSTATRLLDGQVRGRVIVDVNA